VAIQTATLFGDTGDTLFGDSSKLLKKSPYHAHNLTAREAARGENYHVRAPSAAKLREIFRLETERSKAKALVCEWEDGAVEVQYRGE
jgi:hypothetical protein